MTTLRDGTVSFLVGQERTLATSVAQLREAQHAAVDLLRERDRELEALQHRDRRLIIELRELRAQTRRRAA